MVIGGIKGMGAGEKQVGHAHGLHGLVAVKDPDFDGPHPPCHGAKKKKDRPCDDDSLVDVAFEEEFQGVNRWKGGWFLLFGDDQN